MARHETPPSFRIPCLCLPAWAFSPRAFSASFDCTKASSPVEALICVDPETSSLDDKLQQAYKMLQATVAASSKKALIEEQRHLIMYTRDVCQEEACLQHACKARVAVRVRNEKYIVDDTSCEPRGDGGACVPSCLAAGRLVDTGQPDTGATAPPVSTRATASVHVPLDGKVRTTNEMAHARECGNWR